MSQGYFKFKPITQEIDSYFIIHSGIAEEFNSAQHVIEQFSSTQNRKEGLVVYVCGPKGSGKSSFIRVLEEACVKSEIPYTTFSICNENEVINVTDGVALSPDAIVSIYQDNKIRGGVLFFEAQDVPEEVVKNPHVSSRLLSGTICKLEYPQEEELRPILISLLERHYLRLRDKHIDEILQRVPAVPKYFELISQSIDELISSQGKLNISKLKDVLEVHS